MVDCRHWHPAAQQGSPRSAQPAQICSCTHSTKLGTSVLLVEGICTAAWRSDKARGRAGGSVSSRRGRQAGARDGGRRRGQVGRGKAGQRRREGGQARPRGPIPAPASPPRRLQSGGRAGGGAAYRSLRALLQNVGMGAAPAPVPGTQRLALTVCDCQAAQRRGQNPRGRHYCCCPPACSSPTAAHSSPEQMTQI